MLECISVHAGQPWRPIRLTNHMHTHTHAHKRAHTHARMHIRTPTPANSLFLQGFNPLVSPTLRKQMSINPSPGSGRFG